MTVIIHRILRRSPKKKKKGNLTDEILLPTTGEKKQQLRNGIDFAFFLIILRLTGNTEYEHAGQFGGQNFQ